MSKVQILRGFVNQRLILAAEEIFVLFERTIADYEEELCRSKVENERKQKLLDAVLKPQLRLHRAEVSADERPSDQQECSPNVDQKDTESPHIKEEEEEEALQGLEECDGNKFPFSPVSVKIEEDEEKSQSSQLPQRQSEMVEKGEVPADVQDLVSKEEHPPQQQECSPHVADVDPFIKEEQEELWSSQKRGQLQQLEEADGSKFLIPSVPVEDEEKPESSQLHERRREQMETDADADDCGGTETSRNLQTQAHLQPGIKDRKKDSCDSKGAQMPQSTQGNQSAAKCLTYDDHDYSGKTFWCSHCGKAFYQKSNLKSHMRIHTGQKPYSCKLCKKRFAHSINLRVHTRRHTDGMPLHCDSCDTRFDCLYKYNKHRCGGASATFHNPCSIPEGEQLQGLQQTDLPYCTAVSVDNAEGGEKPQSSNDISEVQRAGTLWRAHIRTGTKTQIYLGYLGRPFNFK